MENKSVSKYTSSFGVSLALCSFINAVLVVIKEKSPAVQSAMQKLTGHHWITHSAIIIFLFVAFGLALSKAALPANRLIKTIVAGVFVSGLIIVGFYLIAD
jgi:hypothetical protein